MKLNRFKSYGIFILSYGLLCFVMLIKTFNFLYPMLVFNTILATLPLVFMTLSHGFKKEGKKIWAWLFFLLWLVFFPNALYMITDFIHITGNHLIQYDESLRYEVTHGVIYSTNITSWMKLLIIGIGSIYATMVGLLSLDMVMVKLEKKGKGFQGITLLLISFLSGVGVYIGRFLRLNSWDILSPWSLIKNLIPSINRFSMEFALIFAIYTLAIYGIYLIFKHNHK